jgi:nicotinate phosphoribosyltransferase
MVESYLREGMTADATFSLYIRPTPERPWFLAMGVHRVLELLDVFRYGSDELEYLRSIGLSSEAIDYLGSLSASGQVWAVDDGTVVLAEEPIVEVTAPLPFAQLIETAVINLVQYPTLVATKAARVVMAAKGRSVVDFGFRRAHGLETGVEAALAAYVGGVSATSNVEAGHRYGIPVVGTMAHSFVLSFGSELDAFRAFAADHPDDVTLLVDTYDTLDGVRNAIVVAEEMRSRGQQLRAIRLDSGDIYELALQSRRLLDEAGFPDVRLFASGGLEEYAITELLERGAPIDSFGVGTDLVTSGDRPAVDISYKLVAYDGRPLAKRSAGKVSLPGPKQVFRAGDASSDVLGVRDEVLEGRPLLSQAVGQFDLERIRATAASELVALPEEWKRPVRRVTPPRPRRSNALRELADRVRAATGGT